MYWEMSKNLGIDRPYDYINVYDGKMIFLWIQKENNILEQHNNRNQQSNWITYTEIYSFNRDKWNL